MTILRSQRRRRLLGVVALSGVVAIVAAAFNTGVIGGFPPRPKPSGLQISTAVTHVSVDLPSPSLMHRRALPQDYNSLVKRAELLGRAMVSPPVLDRIAHLSSVPSDQLGGVARTTAFVPLSLTEPGSEQRASEIEESRLPYRLEIQARPTTPIIDIYSQAPTTAEAERLANAAIAGLRGYLENLARQQGFAEPEPVALRQLGTARGGVANGGATLIIAVLTFLIAFAMSCVALLGIIHVRRRRLSTATDPAPPPPARLETARPETSTGDDWPHTTRLLPWMLAGFIAILWLVPFNDIELNISSPIDLKFDRLVLPFLGVVWLFAFAAGGRLAPRLRLTWIHVALGALLACALLSVVLDARYLNQSLELDLSLKKLPLLVSYVSLFVITASTVRRSEIRAYVIYTLALAVVLALGMIWEYRFKQNLFFEWSDKLLPGNFVVTQDSAAAVDHLGRRLVRGSAEAPLEAVTMITLALPFVLVGFMHATRWRGRVLYGLAACALVAAMFATYRKSALLAPVSVGLTLAYFRRRELLRLAPLFLVLVLVVSALSPGAIHATVSQFTRSDATTVPTVSDRTSDYDGVRPDVWSHLAFGRGWGSYDHTDYRILDSEILHRTIEIGVVGLIVYLLVGISVIASARATIASRDPRWAPVALAGAAGAVGFLVISTLYDVMSFPHGPYIFLYIAGLVAVAIGPPQEREGSSTRHPHAALSHRARQPRIPRRKSSHRAGSSLKS